MKPWLGLANLTRAITAYKGCKETSYLKHRSRAYAADPPKAVFPQTGFNFGKAVRGDRVEHEFALKNEGGSPLRIQKVDMTPPLLVTRMPAQIAPGVEAKIHFELETSGLQGPFEGQIVVYLDDPALPEAPLTFTGEIVSPIEVSPIPAFFVAGQRGQGKQQSREIINHEPKPLYIEQIEHPTERFTTRLETLKEGQHYRLTLILKPDGPGGKKTETILLKTSSKTTPVLKVPANTYLRERVYTFPDGVDLGALRLADIRANSELLEQTAQTLMVYQSGGSDFQVRLSTDLPALNLSSERGPKGDRHQITITLIKEKVQGGPIKGSIFIETNDPQFPRLIVPVSGLIIEG